MIKFFDKSAQKSQIFWPWLSEKFSFSNYAFVEDWILLYGSYSATKQRHLSDEWPPTETKCFQVWKFYQFQNTKIYANLKCCFGYILFVFLGVFWLLLVKKALKFKSYSKFLILEGSGTSYLQKTFFTDNHGQNILRLWKNHGKIVKF